MKSEAARQGRNANHHLTRTVNDNTGLGGA
jgi:hypothetical protein